jgi:Rrf2 family protein
VELIVMLSQKARYALKALFTLAARPTGQPVMIAEIAAEAGVPRKFLEQILLELKKRGIVHSHRGKHGGYALGRTADKITFAEVIRVIDGPLALSPCASVTAYRRCDDCVDEATCTLRKVLLAVRDATADILENRTLIEALTPPAPKKSKRRSAGGSPAAGRTTVPQI